LPIKTIFKYAWWKLLLLTLLYAWISVINIWFGSSFFIAIIYGAILGWQVTKTLFNANVPISGAYVITAMITTVGCLYIQFGLYTSMVQWEVSILPGRIWENLQAIAYAGSEVGGFIIEGPMKFEGTGYYVQWIVESVLVMISAIVSAKLSE
jgi:hypothetical protein